MNTDTLLYRNHIFLVPIGRYLGYEEEAYHIVYAPLVGKMLVADSEGLKELSKVIPELTFSGDIKRLLSKVDSARDLQKMSVLPNHICNFSCSYCYAATGRSNVSLQQETLDKALEYFIDPLRLQERHLSLSFIGGGEPLLSWNLVEHGIRYAHTLASRYGFNLLMTLTTNGSIMNDEIVRCLKDYQVLPNISFDIIEEAQNKHRKHFTQVCETIDKLCDSGLTPVVNATITPDTVERMTEMFNFMDERFPKVTNMVFEPVVSNHIFVAASELGSFYDKYLDQFFSARNKAVKAGKNITCRIFKNVDSLLERGCPSKLALTPHSDLSICYCTSSPKEKMYYQRIYGWVDAGGVHIDEEKFQRINNINVYSFAKCDKCFAKWHCAGGCMCPNDLYDEQHLDEVCRFTKEMIRRTLIQRLEEQCRIDGLESLKEYCHRLSPDSEL